MLRLFMLMLMIRQWYDFNNYYSVEEQINTTTW